MASENKEQAMDVDTLLAALLVAKGRKNGNCLVFVNDMPIVGVICDHNSEGVQLFQKSKEAFTDKEAAGLLSEILSVIGTWSAGR